MQQPRLLIIGNSDGIGLALTRLLLVRGKAVVGVSRSPSPLQQQYRHVVQDVSAPEYATRLSQLIEEVGGVSDVVYCAGIGEQPTFDQLDLDCRVLEVNLLGAVRTLAVVVPHLLRQGGGRCLVLSSQADCIISHQATSYTASKAGLSSYVQGLGLALRGSGVRLCNVRFGFVDTKMARAGWQPFRISPEQAARVLFRLLESRCPLSVTYPRRMALLVHGIAWAQRLRVAWS